MSRAPSPFHTTPSCWLSLPVFTRSWTGLLYKRVHICYTFTTSCNWWQRVRDKNTTDWYTWTTDLYTNMTDLYTSMTDCYTSTTALYTNTTDCYTHMPDCYTCMPDCYTCMPDYYTCIPDCYTCMPDCYTSTTDFDTCQALVAAKTTFLWWSCTNFVPFM